MYVPLLKQIMEDALDPSGQEMTDVQYMGPADSSLASGDIIGYLG
jgi:hypothetical protein